jgi:hypothetical protein
MAGGPNPRVSVSSGRAQVGRKLGEALLYVVEIHTRLSVTRALPIWKVGSGRWPAAVRGRPYRTPQRRSAARPPTNEVGGLRVELPASSARSPGASTRFAKPHCPLGVHDGPEHHPHGQPPNLQESPPCANGGAAVLLPRRGIALARRLSAATTAGAAQCAAPSRNRRDVCARPTRATRVADTGPPPTAVIASGARLHGPRTTSGVLDTDRAGWFEPAFSGRRMETVIRGRLATPAGSRRRS